MSARTEAIRASLAERSERDRALPRVLCQVCGGWAHQGEGTRDPEPAFMDVHARQERAHWLAGLPDNVDGWRRVCGGCAGTTAAGQMARVTLSDLIGVTDVSEADAQRVLNALVTFDPVGMTFRGGISAEAHEQATGTPWGHVAEDERERLREAYADLVASRMPRPSSWGACGACGRAAAVGEWWQAPSTVHWPNGSPVAFCASCAAVWRRRGEPSDLDDLHRVGVEAATGRPVPLGSVAPESFRLFCESRAADSAGLGEPWSWSAELRAYIESVWESEPDYAPEGRRDEFDRRHDERERERAAYYRQERERRASSTW
jgi:hypothetical protein